MNIVLGTTSKYKISIFKKLGLSFKPASPSFDEEKYLNEHSLITTNISQVLSLKKAQSLKNDFPNSLIITADQVCLLEDQVFGKAGNYLNALATLNKLNGRTHQLYTSYTIIYENKCIEHTDITSLTMYEHKEEFLKKYLERDKPYDCAGSYKLESYGTALFSDIDTRDYHAIIGLPILALAKDLRALGVNSFLEEYE